MDTLLIVFIILAIFWFIKPGTEGIKNISCNTKDCKIYSHLDATPICKKLCKNDNQSFEYTGNYKIDTQQNSCECMEPLDSIQVPVGQIEKFADLSVQPPMTLPMDDTNYDKIEEKRLKRYSNLIFG